MAVDIAFLDAFSDAWNRHDADGILGMMTPDCVFQQSVGPDVDGKRHAGQSAVRVAVEGHFAAYPDSRWNGPRHFISGDRGVSEWTYTATGPAGPVEVLGCDVFTFRDGLIAVKDSFRKSQG